MSGHALNEPDRAAPETYRTERADALDTPPALSPQPRTRPSRARWVVVPLAFLVCASLAAGTLYFSLESRANRDAAVRWRHRAQQSDKLLTARTHQLNARSTALNRTAAALARSESDVRTLEKRQRKLADEKAQVEDQRGAMVVQTSLLATLADEQRTCSNGLSTLLSEFANGDYEAVNADAAAVGDACRAAQADFARFQSQYGTS